MRRGFFGGTFNPPHLGHIRAAAAAAERLGLERLALIPTGAPPHKALPAGSADTAQRLEMTRLAAEELPHTQVLDWETRRSGASYTALTVERLLAMHPEDELWLLCGSDMLLSLPEWYHADWLLRHVSVAAYPRREGELERMHAFAAELRDAYGTAVQVIEIPPVETSSTELRQLLAQGQGGELLPQPVYAYILDHRLYGVRPDPEALWPLVRPRLSDKRQAHVRGCREEALRLALRWGADPLDAQNAALLHDITKRMPMEEQLHCCEECGIIMPNFEQAYESILHAFSGAAVAWKHFGVSEEVREAIRWHTTAKPGMTLLEKLIWLADYIEPTRCFPGVEELRELALRDLDEAMRQALGRNLAHLRQSGKRIHPLTELAYASLQGDTSE